ncbi:hypothetical protein D1AOALGA4SA_9481 [Olavius algarvensis Delta 1 endosymbiont]|nr:hypothetical protein D1AOALGA4SA_9481 [Olavius algarvensis Delta 1 endosymbiont]
MAGHSFSQLFRINRPSQPDPLKSNSLIEKPACRKIDSIN